MGMVTMEQLGRQRTSQVFPARSQSDARRPVARESAGEGHEPLGIVRQILVGQEVEIANSEDPANPDPIALREAVERNSMRRDKDSIPSVTSARPLASARGSKPARTHRSRATAASIRAGADRIVINRPGSGADGGERGGDVADVALEFCSGDRCARNLL